jgi:hypothetical protein
VVGHVTVTTTSIALGCALISIRAVARDSVSIHTARPAHAQLASPDVWSTVVILLGTFLFQRRRERVILPGAGVDEDGGGLRRKSTTVTSVLRRQYSPVATRISFHRKWFGVC